MARFTIAPNRPIRVMTVDPSALFRDMLGQWKSMANHYGGEAIDRRGRIYDIAILSLDLVRESGRRVAFGMDGEQQRT